MQDIIIKKIWNYMEEKKKIVVTGFMPFGGDDINPTEIILSMLPKEIDGFLIDKLLLPVEFIKARDLIINEYDRINPIAVIMLGQAGKRKSISIEKIAKNIMDARIPDNSGYQPKKFINKRRWRPFIINFTN